MFYFIKKSYESKEGHSPSHFYRKHYENREKMSPSSGNAYVSKTRKKTVYETNKQRPKMIWVPKVKN